MPGLCGQHHVPLSQSGFFSYTCYYPHVEIKNNNNLTVKMFLSVVLSESLLSCLERLTIPPQQRGLSKTTSFHLRYIRRSPVTEDVNSNKDALKF